MKSSPELEAAAKIDAKATAEATKAVAKALVEAGAEMFLSGKIIARLSKEARLVLAAHLTNVVSRWPGDNWNLIGNALTRRVQQMTQGMSLDDNELDHCLLAAEGVARALDAASAFAARTGTTRASATGKLTIELLVALGVQSTDGSGLLAQAALVSAVQLMTWHGRLEAVAKLADPRTTQLTLANVDNVFHSIAEEVVIDDAALSHFFTRQPGATDRTADGTASAELANQITVFTSIAKSGEKDKKLRAVVTNLYSATARAATTATRPGGVVHSTTSTTTGPTTVASGPATVDVSEAVTLSGEGNGSGNGGGDSGNYVSPPEGAGTAQIVVSLMAFAARITDAQVRDGVMAGCAAIAASVDRAAESLDTARAAHTGGGRGGGGAPRTELDHEESRRGALAFMVRNLDDEGVKHDIRSPRFVYWTVDARDKLAKLFESKQNRKICASCWKYGHGRVDGGATCSRDFHAQS